MTDNQPAAKGTPPASDAVEAKTELKTQPIPIVRQGARSTQGMSFSEMAAAKARGEL